eukprot:288358_1
MTSDYRSTDKLNVHNEAIENMQKYSVNDNRMTSKFAIGDEIEFNSDPEDINDEQSHIYRGRIKHIKSKHNQITIALNNDCGTYAYFIDEISIKKCIIDETKYNYMSEEKQLNEIIYSFGHSYSYWNTNKRNYIQAKYNNLQQELLNNKIFTIGMNQFNVLHKKATKKLQCKLAKTLIAYNVTFCKIKKNDLITLEHILSVLFYTDYDELSYYFSKTFRLSNTESKQWEQCAKMNGEYGNWSRLLIETVNVFGDKINKSQIDIFYHGISCLLTFPSFLTVFNSPTSTTKQLCVATVFASETGAILELKHGRGYAMKYFSCGWLSSYSNEDELLFISPQHSSHQLRFHSIRSVENEQNYEYYIHALTILNYVIKGNKHLKDTDKITKFDKSIIKRFLSDNDNKKQKFPQYIKNVFKVFTRNTDIIVIKITYVNQYYKSLIPILFDGDSMVADFYNICNTFRNCKKVTIKVVVESI